MPTIVKEKIKNKLIDNTLTFSTNLTQSSPFFYGYDFEDEFIKTIKEYKYDKLFLVTNELVFSLHGENFLKALGKAGEKVECVFLKDGEENKTLPELENLLEALMSKKVSKDSILMAFGGGIVGNITGLAAALIFRGIRFIEIPTTSMALTDGTLSNKQAVNGRLGKNHFGVYYRPIFIWADLKYCLTEPVNLTKGAIVEGVKNGFIFNPSLLGFISSVINSDLDITLEERHLLFLKIFETKMKILIKDPTEIEYSMALEYGHTFGHAIEFSSKRISHGEAVAIGMCIAAKVAYKKNICSYETYQKHIEIFRDIMGLDISIPENITPRDIMSIITSDNKRKKHGIAYVLIEKEGVVYNPSGSYTTYLEDDFVLQCLEEYKNEY